MLYLDTSALLKLYLLEAGSSAVQARIVAQDLPLPVWEIQELEFVIALRLKAFWGELLPDQAEAQIARFEDRRRRGQYVYPDIDRSELLNTFRRLSRETPRLGCRTMDILHVACALWISASEFLSFDQRQITLARHAGLKVAVLA